MSSCRSRCRTTGPNACSAGCRRARPARQRAHARASAACIPAWLLPRAAAAGGARDRPCTRARCSLLTRPHRVEAGWWDRRAAHRWCAITGWRAASTRACCGSSASGLAARARQGPQGLVCLNSPALVWRLRHDCAWPGCPPATRSCAASRNFSFLRGASHRRNWSSAPRSWATRRWRSPTNAPWPASCARHVRPRRSTGIEAAASGAQFEVECDAPFTLVVLARNLTATATCASSSPPRAAQPRRARTV